MESKDLSEVISASAVTQRFVQHEGFLFTSIVHPANIYDAIIIRAPETAKIQYGGICGAMSKRSLEEHIALINRLGIEKAFIIGENLNFLPRCPSLKYLCIHPADSAADHFDYTPLYAMPEIKSLYCDTIYGDAKKKTAEVDLCRISGLEDVTVSPSGHLKYSAVPTLKSLHLPDYAQPNLVGLSNSPVLDTVSLTEAKIRSLNGIEVHSKLQCLYLAYCRRLSDISALGYLGSSLRALRIENCPKITDFSVLNSMTELEHLFLTGSNSIPSLEFLKKLPKLQTLVFSVNVSDGDITPCLNLSYVYMERGRKHYNLQDRDLPKGRYYRGNEHIDKWRQVQ